MTEFQLRGILHRDDALLFRNELREDVQQRRLSGTGSSGDQNIAPRPHRLLQEERHRPGQSAEADQILIGQFVALREQ